MLQNFLATDIVQWLASFPHEDNGSIGNLDFSGVFSKDNSKVYEYLEGTVCDVAFMLP